MDDKVIYWVEMSDYDVETADAMLATGRYLYVGFMCHQTIEKILKGNTCGFRSTSCADQLAIAVRTAYEQQKSQN